MAREGIGAPVGLARVSAVARCPDGLPLRADLYAPEHGAGPLPVTVVCHGFKGFKDWGMFPQLARALVRDGRAVITLDLSHNGVGETRGVFDRLDLFREQTPSRGVADLRLLLDRLGDGTLFRGPPLRRDGPVSLVGHSLGGAYALLLAAADSRVGRLATLNGVASLDRFGPAGRAELARTGRVDVVNARTGQVMPLGAAYFDDADRIDLRAAAGSITVPTLVVQGADDPHVTVEEGRRLAGWIPGARLVTIPGGDHTFGASHPWAGWTRPLTAVRAELEAFLPSLARSEEG